LSANGKVNIVPGFETYLGNYRVIKRMLAEMGVELHDAVRPSEVFDTPADGEFRMYAGGTTMDEVKDAPNGITTLLQPAQLEKTKFVENTWKHDIPKLNIPMGVEWTDEFLMKVSEVTGKPIPLPELGAAAAWT
jgi:nitrogenase molybdenum-iron protein beta chain